MDDGTRARFPAVPPAAGHYESYYMRAAHPTDPLGVWIRYTVHKRPDALPCKCASSQKPSDFQSLRRYALGIEFRSPLTLRPHQSKPIPRGALKPVTRDLHQA